MNDIKTLIINPKRKINKDNTTCPFMYYNEFVQLWILFIYIYIYIFFFFSKSLLFYLQEGKQKHVGHVKRRGPEKWAWIFGTNY